MHRLKFFILAPFVTALLFPIHTVLSADTLERAGWVEEVRIFPGALPFDAKLDTGAKSASLHAEHITAFSRDGEDWVKFTVIDKNGTHTEFERNVQRVVKIKRHNKPPAERPVILLGICLGNHFEETEVNLTDRSNYQYPLLIGRMFLSDRFMVDASSQRLLAPQCPPESSK